MRPHVLVVFNPAAGQRRERLFRASLAALEAAGARVTTRATGGRGDAEAFAREADASAFDVIAAAGGDGTINEVINGLVDRSDARALPLGLVPLGTANVLAREIGLAVEPGAIARTLLGGRTRTVRLGRANGRVFGAMAGIGFDARVVAGVPLALKRRVGRWAYGWESLRRFALFSEPRLDVRVDGARTEATVVIVMKGRLYGGSFVCAPNGRLEDPTFEVVLPGGRGRLALLRFALALGRGRIDRLAGARIVTAREVEVGGPAGEPVQADGDIVTSLPVRFAIDSRPLELLVP